MLPDVVRNTGGELGRFLHAALLDPADVKVPATVGEVRRRRGVSGVTLAAGAATLGWSLSLAPGDSTFYVATALLAVVWVLGARLSGPVPIGRGRRRSGEGTSLGILQSVIVGGALLAIFLAGALVVSGIPLLRDPVQQLLDHARYGSLPLVALITVVNGVSEEYFFRGALFQALPRRWQIGVGTALYAVVTAFSLVPLLVFAAVLLGVVVSLQRRATGGFLAPTVTHITWSLGMLLLLPYVLDLGTRLWG